MADLILRAQELFRWTEEERAKWRAWLEAHPAALRLQVQPDGRFSDVGSLIDHVFLVEARHLARLQGSAVPSDTGVDTHDGTALFAYGAGVREALTSWLPSLSDAEAATVRTFTVQSGTVAMTPRKLVVHIALHEVRHWAQVALVVRQAGLPPPGNHDLFYSHAID